MQEKKLFILQQRSYQKFLKKSKKRISLATIYNTVHAFKNKNYLKEISINLNKSYFDTNVSNHHHFFNESTHELIDLKKTDVGPIKIKKKIPGKKIKTVEVLVKISDQSPNIVNN